MSLQHRCTLDTNIVIASPVDRSLNTYQHQFRIVVKKYQFLKSMRGTEDSKCGGGAEASKGGRG